MTDLSFDPSWYSGKSEDEDYSEDFSDVEDDDSATVLRGYCTDDHHDAYYGTISSSDSESDEDAAKFKQRTHRSNDEDESDGGEDDESDSEQSDNHSQKILTRSDGPDILSGLPLDILFEIFHLLKPGELVALARVNKAFFVTLNQDNVKPIWKTALENAEIMPCPPGLKTFAWANLWAGPPICQKCQSRIVPDVAIDFGLLRRLCRRCLKANLISAEEFEKKCPGHDTKILRFVFHTNVCPPHLWSHTRTRYFWMPDVVYVYKKRWEFLCSPWPMQDQLTEWLSFCTRRSAFLKSLIKIAQTARKWAANAPKKRRAARMRMHEERYKEIERRFVALGYIPSDVIPLRGCRGILVSSPLTEYTWNRVLDEYLPHVVDEAERRIADAKQKLIDSRSWNFTRAYMNFIMGLVAKGIIQFDQWPRFPSSSDLVEVKPFVSLVNAPPDVAVDFSHFTHEDFSRAVAAWKRRRANTLIEMLPIRITNRLPVKDRPEITDMERLELATAVYRCTQKYCPGYPLFGLDETLHDCPQPKFEFCYEGSTAVKALMAMLGRDTEKCRPTDLDDLDLRFWCLKCGVQTFSTGSSDSGAHQGRTVYSWRQCVIHSMSFTTSQPRHPPRWGVLDDNETALVKKYESGPYTEYTWFWSCNRCTAHFDNPLQYHALTIHLRDEHDISEPKEGPDFFKTQRYHYSKPLVLLETPISCPLPGSKTHQRRKDRGMKDPVTGKDVVELWCLGGKSPLSPRLIPVSP